MKNFNGSLDDLTINPNYNRESDRAFTRQEAFVLTWLICHPEGRTYRDIMRGCKLTLEQCETALQGLIEMGLLSDR